MVFFWRWYECIQYMHPLQRPEWVQILLRRHKSQHMHTICVCVCSIWKLLYFYWMCLHVSHNCADLRLWSGLLVSVGSGNAGHFLNIPTQKSVRLARIPLANICAAAEVGSNKVRTLLLCLSWFFSCSTFQNRLVILVWMYERGANYGLSLSCDIACWLPNTTRQISVYQCI